MAQTPDERHRRAVSRLSGGRVSPPRGRHGTYRSVFRFDSLEHLEAFERSDFRTRMLAEAAPIFAADTAWERLTGLDFWFDLPVGSTVPQPSPHRMALVLIAVVTTLVLLLNLVLGPLIDAWPLPLRVLLLVTIQIASMTYVIMPRLTPLIARLIHPTTSIHQRKQS